MQRVLAILGLMFLHSALAAQDSYTTEGGDVVYCQSAGSEGSVNGSLRVQFSTNAWRDLKSTVGLPRKRFSTVRQVHSQLKEIKEKF